jgi:hypothetical protein
MNRLEKYLEKQFKVENDKLGIPSIIIVEGVERSLVQSIDRKRMFDVMKRYLMDTLALTEEMGIEITESFLDRKYCEYMDFVMKM